MEGGEKKRIGLIAGNGRFPILFAEGARGNGFEVVAVGIRGETQSDLERYVDRFYWVGIAQMGRLIGILKKEGVTNAVMAGGIAKANVFAKFMNVNFMPDLRTVNLIYKVIKDRQDHSILGAIADELSKDGIELLPAAVYVPELLARRGALTRRKPSGREMADIEFGWEIARRVADMDVGQCIVVKERVVMAVEAFEGTDETIKRGSGLGGKGVVVIKLSKQEQDERFDLPTIGKETVSVLDECGASALAIEAGKTIVLDSEDTIKAADDNKIAIFAM